MADIDIPIDDVEITEERVRRKHQVTAKHLPSGLSVTRDGIHYYITRNDALTSLEKLVAEHEGGADDDGEEKSD